MHIKRLIWVESVAIVVAAIIFAQDGIWHGVAALAGGGIAFLGGLLMVRRAQRNSFSAPGAVRSLFATEAVKLALTIVVFFVAALLKIPLLPLFSTYCGALVLFWGLVIMFSTMRTA